MLGRHVPHPRVRGGLDVTVPGDDVVPPSHACPSVPVIGLVRALPGRCARPLAAGCPDPPQTRSTGPGRQIVYHMPPILSRLAGGRGPVAGGGVGTQDWSPGADW